MVDSRGTGSGGVLPERGSRRITGGSRAGDGAVFVRILLACGVVVAILLFAWTFGSDESEGRYVVAGDSMSPTLVSGQEIEVDPDAPVQVGSVVVFEEPEGWRSPGRTAVKRVAAVAGDTVSLHCG